MGDITDGGLIAPTTNLGQITQRFSNSYFSGAQAQIIIGDYIVDEVIEVEGTYSVNKIPIYGYASKHFNTVATGKVIVSGNLAINYISNGYLWSFIKDVQTKEEDRKDILSLGRRKPLISVEAGSNIEPGKEIDAYTALMYSGELDVQKLQQQYWGLSDTQDKINNFAANSNLRPEFRGPFNIVIRDFKLGTSITTQEKIIVDCFIDKFATLRRSDGSPVVEIYTFIAKTII